MAKQVQPGRGGILHKYLVGHRGSVTTNKIISELVDITGIHEKDVELIVTRFIGQIKEHLTKGNQVNLPDFGLFAIRRSKERYARVGWGKRKGSNAIEGDDRFRKGTRIKIPEKLRPYFYFDKQLKVDVWAGGIKRGDCPPATVYVTEDNTTVPIDIKLWTASQLPPSMRYASK